MAGILIIKFGALGDVIVATSAIRSIQLASPATEIWVMTGRAFVDTFAHWPGINVYAVERKGVWNTARQLLWLRRRRFDRIIDLQSNDRSALLCALSGVGIRVGNHPRFPYTLHPSSAHGRDEPGYRRQALMLAAAGLPPPQLRPYIPLSDAEQAAVGTWLTKHRLAPDGFVLMHAGASPAWPAKRWPHFAALARLLGEQGLDIVWLGAGADKQVNAPLAQTIGIDATDAFSIVQLAELARSARCAITNDSGPMHALSAAGIPIYGLFGPTDWRRCHAMGQAERALTNNKSCVACARPDRATASDHSCLPGIAAASVFERLLKDGVLAARTAR